MKLVLPLLVICIIMLGAVNVQLFFLPDNSNDVIINDIEIIKLLIQDIDLDIHNLSKSGLK